MSSYKLSSPIDIFSSSATGQVNLYSAGSSNAVQIKAPALAANVPFILPATAGSIGQYLTYGALASTWLNGSTNNTSLPMCISFITGITTAAQIATVVPTIVGTLYFFGTTTEGTPSAIYAVIGGIVSSGTQVRLFDNTNSIIIGLSVAVATTATPQIVTIPISGAIAATAAQWYVQLARTGGVGTARIWSIHVLP